MKVMGLQKQIGLARIYVGACVLTAMLAVLLMTACSTPNHLEHGLASGKPEVTITDVASFLVEQDPFSQGNVQIRVTLTITIDNPSSSFEPTGPDAELGALIDGTWQYKRDRGYRNYPSPDNKHEDYVLGIGTVESGWSEHTLELTYGFSDADFIEPVNDFTLDPILHSGGYVPHGVSIHINEDGVVSISYYEDSLSFTHPFQTTLFLLLAIVLLKAKLAPWLRNRK